MVDDFLYICDDAYNRMEFVRMEKDILRTVDFNLGMPISYRFLRRLAKVRKQLVVEHFTACTVSLIPSSAASGINISLGLDENCNFKSCLLLSK